MNWADALAASTSLPWIVWFLIKLLFAFVLGGILGLEGGSKQPVAGVRAHMIIACGSCLISACGTDMVVAGVGTGDATRLAGQILAGIGFVGAGVIIRRGAGVTTTAATIFFSAGIGIACGLGFLAFALITTLMVILGMKMSHKVFPLEEIPGKSLKVVCRKDVLPQVREMFPGKSRINSVTKYGDRLELRIYVTDLSWSELDKLVDSMLQNPEILSVQIAEDRVV